MKTMKEIIGADAAKLAGLQIDLLQKVRSGQISLSQMERFSNLSSAEREACFSGRKSFLEALRLSGYLDTSFEGRETHPLIMRPLTKEQAFDEYRKSGGKTWIWPELEKNIPYVMPKVGVLDVMLLGFGRSIESDEGVVLMDDLGVRPLIFEEHIQYGTQHPSHQKKNPLVALTKYTLVGNPHAPLLGFGGVGRLLRANAWGGVWGDWCRFPVVRK